MIGKHFGSINALLFVHVLLDLCSIVFFSQLCTAKNLILLLSQFFIDVLCLCRLDLKILFSKPYNEMKMERRTQLLLRWPRSVVQVEF